MKNLRPPHRHKFHGLSALVLLLLACRITWAGQATGGDLMVTKDLPGASGADAISGGIYTLGYAFGEQIAGDTLNNATDQIISGYYGGRFGNGQTFQLLSTAVGTGTPMLEDGVQVGVPLNAPITLTFSDQLDPSTLKTGIFVQVVTDHLGQTQQSDTPIEIAYTSGTTSLTITPQGTWSGNTLYNIITTPDLHSIDSFQLAANSPTPFLTLLDPSVQNVVLNPINPLGANASPSSSSNGTALNIQIPQGSLADFSAVLVSQDPLNSPLQVSPQMIQAANAKALAAGGPYRTPVALLGINAIGRSGQPLNTLSQPAQVSVNFSQSQGIVSGSNPLVRPQTLALWVLDQKNQLWVKIPASQVSPLGVVTAPVTQFTVFALMGSADGSASDAYVFPNPWRPHGPNAGTGAGQTGTEAAGMTFTTLPSECTIKIYTIAGGLVRELHHSDTGGSIGEEIWDGRTSSGDSAASGVYLWRVESSVDGKNGKLMIIR